MKKRLGAVLGSACLLAGIALAKKTPRQPDELAAALSKAPAAAGSRANPYESQRDAALLAGKKLFDQHCAACHGSDARGRDNAPDLHSSVIQSASDGALVWFLKNGNLRQGMPSWSGLPEQQRWQIVTYLKTLR